MSSRSGDRNSASAGLVPPSPCVWHVVLSLAPGGLERLVVDWTRERNRRAPGSTRVACLDEPGALADLLPEGSVCCVEADRQRGPWDRVAVSRLERLIGRDGTTVVHAHNLSAQQYAVLATRSTWVPVLYTQHGANRHNQSLRDRLRSRLLACFTRRLVAVSVSVKSAMIRDQWIPERRIAVIPNGVSPHVGATSAELAELRTMLGVPRGSIVVGSLGRLAHVKGYDRLVAAFARLLAAKWPSTEIPSSLGLVAPPRKPHEEPVLLLVGDGPEKASLQIQAQALGIGGSVVFAGFRPEARKLLALMDLFVLPSRSEGLSVALLEAMAAGIPVAVTDVGENRVVTQSGECGVILPDEIDQWWLILKHQLATVSSLETRNRCRAAKQRVAEHYSLEATLDAYERAYAEVSVAGAYVVNPRRR